MKMQDLKILIVDDDEMLRKTMVAIFKPLCQVTTATGGNEAFRIVQSQPIDLVFSDVCMPDGTGVELLDRLREEMPGGPQVVLVTGYSMISIEEALAKGALTIVSKPFRKQSLIEVAEKFVSERDGGKK